MEPHRRETADRGPSEIRVDLPLCLRAPQQREGPLADPTHGKCTGVLHSARELRQGSGSGKEETHPAGSRQGRLAHGEEGSGGPRRDTPGVPTLPLPGAPTLREAVAPFQRGGSEPLLRGDRRVGGGARSALRGPERQARAHPIVHPLPLVAASGMTNKAIQTDLVSSPEPRPSTARKPPTDHAQCHTRAPQSFACKCAPLKNPLSQQPRSHAISSSMSW